MPQRRASIDAIRGFCLVNIFVNHIENGFVTSLSPSRLGLSDSADLFVLLSGISTALAMHRVTPRSFRSLVGALWRRAARLYAFNVVVILGTVGLLAIILALRGVEGVHAAQTALLRDHGALHLLWHALTLGQTVGYSNVLRLYIALMLLAPALLHLARLRPWAPLPPVILLWLLAGHFGWVLPNSLSGEPFRLTILPWTLIFTIGIVVGQGLNRGVALPRSGLLAALAVAYLVACLMPSVWEVHVWPMVSDWITTGNDAFWLGASKTYQSPLRLLHVLALAYLAMTLPDAPVIRLLHTVRYDSIVVRIGRRSLPVFVVGAIAVVGVSEGLDLVATTFPGAWLPLLILEVAAIGSYVAVALTLDRRALAGHRRSVRPSNPDPTRTAPPPEAGSAWQATAELPPFSPAH